MPRHPTLSVVVPVFDGGEPFRRCLDGLERSPVGGFELIVVDDGSRDGSAVEARRRSAPAGVRVLATAGREGPAAARNLGASTAEAPWLLFLDADCEPRADTLERVLAVIDADAGDAADLGAFFGSYDDLPAAPGVVSQYKNLLHHWVHHQGAGDAVTFWAGCGAVRREVFDGVGGFDAERYPRPSIEDIELGYRLTAAGHRIRLIPEIQVKHHKVWTLRNLVVTDVRDRALPWTELSLEHGSVIDRLNLDTRNRWSAGAALVLTACAATAPFVPLALVGGVAGGAFLLVANRRLYRFFAARRGPGFLPAAIALHWLAYLYSAGAFAWGVLRRRFAGRPGNRAAEEPAEGDP